MPAPPVDLLCERFYRPVDANRAGGPPMPGQIVSAHTAYPPKEALIVTIAGFDASDPARSRYEIKRFEAADRSHFPLKELQLRSDENAYVYMGKERPLVVVGAVCSRWANPLHDDEIFLCAPMFTFKPKHSDEFVLRCAAFDYPSLFYLPAEAEGCNQSSAVRFEYMQPIARRALRNFAAGSPARAIALSDVAYALFMNHLGRFLFRHDLDPQLCGEMDAYRRLVLASMAPGGQGDTG